MSIKEILELIRHLKPNQYPPDKQIAWLSELDGTIYKEIIATHEDAGEPFTGYKPEDSPDTELLVPYPYAENIYRWYLESKIDVANAELNKYNNSAALFNAAYEEYQNYYNREHMPLQKTRYIKL